MHRPPPFLQLLVALAACPAACRQDAPSITTGPDNSGPDDAVDTGSGIVGSCRTTTMVEDMGMDGVLEFHRAILYDAAGDVLLEDDDQGADGTIDHRYLWVYDDGVPQTLDIDDWADGKVDTRTTYTYDEAGDLVVQTIDEGVDGAPDSVTTNTWDSNHNMLTQLTVSTYGDDVATALWTWTWDSDDNMLTVAFDAAGHHWFSSYTYDAEGHQLRAEAWDGEDLDFVMTDTWEGDLLIVEEVDSAGDGTVETRTTLTYDGNGWLARLEQVNTADGAVNISEAFTYDDRGNVLVEEVTTTERQLRTSTWDEADNLLTLVWSTPDDASTAPTLWSYTYEDGCG